MKQTIRVAGAQIPVCDHSTKYNKEEIFKALDWAKENEVDYLLTPEGALSGWGSYFVGHKEEIDSALKEVEEHQKKCGVSLGLGMSIEDGGIPRNQIRHYNKEGEVIGKTNKTYVTEGDEYFGLVSSFIDSYPLYTFGFPEVTKDGYDGEDNPIQIPFYCTGMICNDMWGSQLFSKPYGSSQTLLYQLAFQDNIDLLLHATNGIKWLKGNDIVKDRVDAIHDFHEANLRHNANFLCTNILTVDNPVRWGWNGDLNTINDWVTSSPSGVVGPTGRWEIQVPRSGRHYFKYDIDVNFRRDAIQRWKEIEEKLKQPPTPIIER